jgi:ABC-type multidrug transport system permease subunit
MRRFGRLLFNEFKLFRTAVPIHMVAIVQPTVLYMLMTVILVKPTFDLNIAGNDDGATNQLIAAMEQVGSPIGAPYIHPILVENDQIEGLRQVVLVEERGGGKTAVQRFGLVDSNMVKNYRNRLTAAALIMWDDALGAQAIRIIQRPWLARDMPYTLYFGMAILPLTVILAASILGGMLTAQEFENDTMREYRLAPTPPGFILAARLTRLVLTGMVSASLLICATGLVTGIWPSSLPQVFLILAPPALIAACLGVIAGLVIQRSIPAFLVGLIASFVGWIMGSAFGLAGHFGGAYEVISLLTPNTHAVELLFPLYFGVRVGNPLLSISIMVSMSLLMLGLTVGVYRRKVLKQR